MMSEAKCCLCCCEFSLANFPRMMPSCVHSACTNCLKNIILKNRNALVVCGTCNNRQQIPQLDLQYFPKNIALIKLIKQKSDIIQPPRSRQQSKNKRSENSSQKRKQKTQSPRAEFKNNFYDINQICQIHSKQKQLICLNDFIKLCPMCAVFGQHKGHKLKTVPQIQRHIQNTSIQYYQLRNKKIRNDGIIKNQTFKLELVQKINTKKVQLTKKIKDEFECIHEAVQLAQKKAYDDLVKRFKQIYDKINNLVKQQNHFQKQYNDWVQSFQACLKKSQSEKLLQNKVKYYFNGPLQSLPQGQTYINKIQQCLNQKKTRIDAYPSSVILQKSQSLIKDIYNHIVLKIEQIFFDSFQYTNGNSSNHLSSRNKLEIGLQADENQNDYNRKPIKVQFSSSQSFLSPINKNKQHISSPRKKSIPKSRAKSKPKQSTGKKQEKNQKEDMQSTTQKIVEIFCSDQSLQTLDLSSFYLNDAQILQILEYVCQRKQIKCLKLSKNKLSNDGFHKCLQYLRNTTNWNLSFNNLTEQALNYLIRQREKTPNLRVVNISNNKANERKAKSYIEQLKKIGIIVTL